MLKAACVYILASKKNGTLYTGVTNNLERRMYEHKHHLVDGFTKKYDVTRLVWFTQDEDIRAAIAFEKKIKNRSRQWKIDLIEKTNPNWDDLAASWLDAGSCDYAQDDTTRGVQGDTYRCAQGDTNRGAQGDIMYRYAQDETYHGRSG